MAVKNRPVVGTCECPNKGCNEQVTVHQVQGGSRKGMLYSRCPKCGPNQSSGATQKHYLATMTPRPGYEDLLDKPIGEIYQEPDQVDDQDNQETVIDDDQEPTSKAGGIIAGIGVVALVIAGIFGVKKP